MSIKNYIIDNKIKSSALVLLGLILFLLIFMYSNKVAPVSWGIYGAQNTDDGIALKGADAVSYFIDDKYTPGSQEHSLQHEGANWYFSSAENKQRFSQSPEKYMPQYGGFCAFAVTQGVTANTKPHSWTIQQDKLYMFNGDDVRTEWVKNISKGSMQMADKNWSER